MSPVTHFFAGWLLASVSPTGRPTTLTRREKALVVAAAVAPDLDGLGIIPEFLTRNSSHPLLWFSEYHHSLHTLAFALACTLGAFLIAGPLGNFRFGRSIFKSTTFKPTAFKPTNFNPTVADPSLADSSVIDPSVIDPAEQGQPTSRVSHPGLTALLVLLSFHLHLLCDLIGARGPDGYQWPIPYLKPFSSAWQLTWHGQWALNAWQNFVITGLLLLATFWIARKYGSSPVELMSQRWNRECVDALRQRF
jgi:LexA-binding, inner membrane-associated putative hydrolase